VREFVVFAGLSRLKNPHNGNITSQGAGWKAPAQSSRTMLRESGMWEQGDLDSYARSTRKSPQNGTKNTVWRRKIR
jgi:hypothetical protein